jgi:hypothetical protein
MRAAVTTSWTRDGGGTVLGGTVLGDTVLAIAVIRRSPRRNAAHSWSPRSVASTL